MMTSSDPTHLPLVLSLSSSKKEETEKSIMNRLSEYVTRASSLSYHWLFPLINNRRRTDLLMYPFSWIKRTNHQHFLGTRTRKSTEMSRAESYSFVAMDVDGCDLEDNGSLWQGMH